MLAIRRNAGHEERRFRVAGGASAPMARADHIADLAQTAVTCPLPSPPTVAGIESPPTPRHCPNRVDLAAANPAQSNEEGKSLAREV